jgi:molecular chaperone DnaK
MTKLIDANTTIPTKKSETFSTAADNQPSVEIHVLQGERPMAKLITELLVDFIWMVFHQHQEVCHKLKLLLILTANGILHVSAKDKGTGKEQKIRIEASSGLTDEEIERMKAEAEKFAEQDKKEKERIEKVNQADSLIFSTSPAKTSSRTVS